MGFGLRFQAWHSTAVAVRGAAAEGPSLCYMPSPSLCLLFWKLETGPCLVQLDKKEKFLFLSNERKKIQICVPPITAAFRSSHTILVLMRQREEPQVVPREEETASHCGFHMQRGILLLLFIKNRETEKDLFCLGDWKSTWSASHTEPGTTQA